eukprot:9255733-Alexandrium_andersonii.AAC.1
MKALLPILGQPEHARRLTNFEVRYKLKAPYVECLLAKARLIRLAGLVVGCPLELKALLQQPKCRRWTAAIVRDLRK